MLREEKCLEFVFEGRERIGVPDILCECVCVCMCVCVHVCVYMCMCMCVCVCVCVVTDLF